MPKQRPQFKDFFDSEPDKNNLLFMAIDEIILPKSQVRQYFDPKKLEQLAESIEQHGVLEPLLITSQNELIAGERRLRASRIAGLTQLPVKILNVSSSEAKTLAIVENLQREDLNPVEETEGILELLQLKLKRERNDIVSLLYKMNKKDDNVIISDCETVKNTFKTLGKLKWESFVINRLRLLNLPESILSAIKQGKIEYTKGITIGRIKDSDFRDKLLDEAIVDNLSLKDIKQKIAQHNNHISINYSDLSTDELIQDLRQSSQKFFRNKKIWSDRKNRKKLEVLLGQLKDLVKE